MIAIDTKHHITFSSTSALPYKACSGKCNKVWWKFDLQGKGAKQCPQCGGKLKPASEGKHFRIIDQRFGDLRESDFSAYTHPDGRPVIDSRTFQGMNLQHVSLVKTEYMEKAKKEWC